MCMGMGMDAGAWARSRSRLPAFLIRPHRPPCLNWASQTDGEEEDTLHFVGVDVGGWVGDPHALISQEGSEPEAIASTQDRLRVAYGVQVVW